MYKIIPTKKTIVQYQGGIFISSVDGTRSPFFSPFPVTFSDLTFCDIFSLILLIPWLQELKVHPEEGLNADIPGKYNYPCPAPT